MHNIFKTTLTVLLFSVCTSVYVAKNSLSLYLQKFLKTLTNTVLLLLLIGGSGPAWAVETPTITASNGLTLIDLTGDAYNIDGARAGTLTFTFQNHSFYLTDFSEIGAFGSPSSSMHVLGVPSTPSAGYDATINLIPGYGYNATFDILEGSDDSVLVNGFDPEPERTPFQPLVRIDYDAGNNKIKVSYDSDDAGSSSSFSINSSGEFSSAVTFSQSVEYTLINTDSTPPTITGTTVASDNSIIAVTISEAVYNTTDGGNLEASDFTLSLSGGAATLSSAAPSSISISGNVYILGLSLSGTPNGSETVTVVPSSSTAIYDSADNAASTSQSNNTVTLVDSLSPTMTITSVTVSDGATSNDATLALTFTSSEATSDFAVGDITISGGALSSFATTSSTVYTAIFTPSGDGAATIDVAGSAFTDSVGNNNTAATQFNWTYDSTSPTMTITSAEMTDGGASDNATLALTFTSSEATTNFSLSDIAVTNATLTSFSATSSTIYTATLTPTGEGAVTVDVTAGAFTDAASNNNTVAIQFNWTHLLDPTTKVDVTGSIKASVNIASQRTQSTFSAISNRLGWLKSHKGQSKTSYQGIRLDFNDDIINALMAAPSASFTQTNWTNEAVNQVNRANDSLSTLESNLVNDVTKAALNEAAIVRQNATGTLNPAFKPVYNGWSLWTDGTVTIGDVDATASSAKQSSKDYSISIGLDKPLNDNRLVGYVLRTGQGSVDVGTSTSKVKSESYSLAGYTAYEGYQNLLMEAVAGVGVVKYNLTRADGVHILKGGRAANQAFASFSASKPATVFGKLSLSPFVKATYNHTSFGAYSEIGGITALTYKEHAIHESQLALGTDVRYQLFVGNIDVYPYARVAYNLDVSDQANEPAQMYYNSAPSKIYSLALDTRNTASVQFAIGADLITMGGINASLDYLRNTVINSGHSQSVSLRIGQAF